MAEGYRDGCYRTLALPIHLCGYKAVSARRPLTPDTAAHAFQRRQTVFGSPRLLINPDLG